MTPKFTIQNLNAVTGDVSRRVVVTVRHLAHHTRSIGPENRFKSRGLNSDPRAIFRNWIIGDGYFRRPLRPFTRLPHSIFNLGIYIQEPTPERNVLRLIIEQLINHCRIRYSYRYASANLSPHPLDFHQIIIQRYFKFQTISTFIHKVSSSDGNDWTNQKHRKSTNAKSS